MQLKASLMAWLEFIDRNIVPIVLTAAMTIVGFVFCAIIESNAAHTRAMADKGYVQLPLLGSNKTIWTKPQPCQ